VTPLQIAVAGIAHVCTAGRNDVWPDDVRAQLARHDRALDTLATETDWDAWWSANVDRIAAENRLARLLNVTPPPPAPFDYDDGLTTT
jgi:hypothetical protein